MNPDTIQSSFKEAVSDLVRLFPEGVDRYRVFTPFHFDDGDHFVIVLCKENNGNWAITDEGHTYMHMSYKTKLSSLKDGTRNKIIEGALEKHKITEHNGKIFTEIDDFENAGNIFYSYIQCLMSITNISYLSRERVVSTFMEDFRSFIQQTVSSDRLELDYRDPTHDPGGKYTVNYRINGMPHPLHVYPIANDAQCRDTDIKIRQFMAWDKAFSTLGVFEDQEKINRKVLSRFTDICDRQFSSLAMNQEIIEKYLQERII